MSDLWVTYDMIREISKMMSEADHQRMAKLRQQAIYRKEKKQLNDEEKVPLEADLFSDPFAGTKEDRFTCNPMTEKKVKKVGGGQQNREAIESMMDTQKTHMRFFPGKLAFFNQDPNTATKNNVELRTPPSTGPICRETSLQMAPKKMEAEVPGYQDPQLKFPLSVAFSGVTTAERDMLTNAESAVLWRAYHQTGDRLPDIIICGDSAFTSLVLLGITRYIPILNTAFLHKVIKDSAIPPLQGFEIERFPSMKQRFARKDIQLSLNCLKLEIDVFPGSFNHPIIGGIGLALVLRSIGADVVRSRRMADFIISDRNNPYTKSTVYKKVDVEWVIESILHGCIIPVEKYFF